MQKVEVRVPSAARARLHSRSGARAIGDLPQHRLVELVRVRLAAPVDENGLHGDELVQLSEHRRTSGIGMTRFSPASVLASRRRSQAKPSVSTSAKIRRSISERRIPQHAARP